MSSLASKLQGIPPQELDLFLETLPKDTLRNVRIKYNLPLPEEEEALAHVQNPLRASASLKRPKTVKKDIKDADSRTISYPDLP